MTSRNNELSSTNYLFWSWLKNVPQYVVKLAETDKFSAYEKENGKEKYIVLWE